MRPAPHRPQRITQNLSVNKSLSQPNVLASSLSPVTVVKRTVASSAPTSPLNNVNNINNNNNNINNNSNNTNNNSNNINNNNNSTNNNINNNNNNNNSANKIIPKLRSETNIPAVSQKPFTKPQARSNTLNLPDNQYSTVNEMIRLLDLKKQALQREDHEEANRLQREVENLKEHIVSPLTSQNSVEKKMEVNGESLVPPRRFVNFDRKNCNVSMKASSSQSSDRCDRREHQSSSIALSVASS